MNSLVDDIAQNVRIAPGPTADDASPSVRSKVELVEKIKKARDERRFDDALTFAEEFRRQHSPDPIVEHIAILARRGLGRGAEAADAARRAVELFPGQKWAVSELAQSLLLQGRIAEAEEQARILLDRHPEAWAGYSVKAACLRQRRRFEEAAALLDAAAQRFPGAAWVAIEATMLAAARSQWDEAIRHAAEIRRCAPTNEFGYRQALRMLRRAGRIAEADDLLKEAASAFSSRSWLYLEGAENANARLDVAEADRWEEADRWLLRGRRRFPDDKELALAYAVRPGRNLKERRRLKGGERMIRRLETLIRRRPDLTAAYVALAEALCSVQQPTRADALLASRLDEVSRDPRAALSWAKIAEFRGDTDDAVERYKRVTEWFPDLPSGYERLAIVLSRRGDRDEAEAVCGQAVERFPTSLLLLQARSKVAENAGDLKAAIERMEYAAQAFPEMTHLKELLYGLKLKLDAENGEKSDRLPNVALDLAVKGSADDAKSVMMQCQSLGAQLYWGCEFGVAQRHFGAEPLSLMRWGLLPHASLVRAIESGFEGVDSDEDVYIEKLWRGHDFEYLVRNRKLSLVIHSFVYSNEIPEETFRRQMCRRLKYLRRLFVDDLQLGRHLFVRKQETSLQSEEVEALHSALRKYGDNTLLYVFKEDDAHRAGTVEIFRPGILFGYIDHFKVDMNGNDIESGLSADCWLEVCSRAHAIWRSNPSTGTVIGA